MESKLSPIEYFVTRDDLSRSENPEMKNAREL